MNKHFLLFVNIWVWGLVLSGCTTVKYPDDKLYAEYAKAIRRGDLEYVIDFVKQYKKYALNDIYILGQHYNPLDVAVVSDSNEIVEFLLAEGADPDVTSPTFKEPLIFGVVRQKKVRALQLFIKYGALVDVHGVNGVSLLEIAASTGSLEMVEMIVEKTNNINATSDEGRNALFGAVYSNNCEIIEFLVRKGIEINKETIDGMLTPLLFAVSLQNVAAAEKLIELGADITIMNNEGYDAKRLANKLGLSIRGLNTSTSN